MGRRATAEELALLNGGAPREQAAPYYLGGDPAPAPEPQQQPKRRRATAEELAVLNSVPVASESAPTQGPASQQPALPATSRLESAGRGALAGALFDFDDEAGGALGGLARLATGGKFSEGYRESRDSLRLKKHAAQQSNPWTYGLSGLAPALAAAPFTGGSSGLSALRTIGTGIAAGAAGGLGASEADLTKGDYAGAGKDALVGGGIGGLVGGALHGVLPRVGTGVVRPTPEAERLMREGADLTLGQMNPRSVVAGMEQANQSTPVLGQMLRDQRMRAQGQWKDSLLRRGAAPGEHVTPSPLHSDQIDEMMGGYNRAYDAIRNAQAQGIVPIQDVAATFRGVTARRGAGVTDDARHAADGFLQDLVTSADQQRGSTTTGELMNIRSRIREEIRGLQPTDDRARLYREAERMVTQDLEHLLPPEHATALRDLDRQYGTFKTLEKAVGKAGDRPEGFTPHEIASAIKQGTPKGAYARGGGGPLRELSRDGASAFQQTVPLTGFGAAMSLPVIRAPVAAANVLANASPGLKRLASGRTLPQRGAQSAARGLQRLSPAYLAAGAGGAGPDVKVMSVEEFRRLYGRDPWAD